ncbi:MAG: RNA polymerase sigma factor [Gaiellaceae bacterium]
MTTMTAVDTTGDARLVEALRAGDEQAFEQLVLRYHAVLLRLARNYVASASVAEEVVQDTWVGVLDGIDRFRGASSVKTWIFRILVNRAMTRGVRERRTVPFSSLQTAEGDDGPTVSADRFTADGSWAVAPRPFELPEDRVGLLELRARLREALADLPERQRIVVGLRDVEGLSSEEVCDLLDLSAENQRVLLHRGRARLQAALAGYQAP